MTRQTPLVPPSVAVPLFAALAVYTLTLFQPQVFSDGDTWWHVGAGDWILAHGRIPKTDPFSHTMPGAPWHAHEWLSEVLMALAHRVGGWVGVAALTGAAAALAAGLMVRRVARSLGGVSLVLVALLALACLGPSLLARPHMLTLPILVIWTSELLAARDAGRAPRLPFALLMTLWANMHGGYVLGLALIGPFALEALVTARPEQRLKVVWTWGLFGVLALAAATITPHGPPGLLFPFQLMTMTSLPYIEEWRASDFSSLSLFELALLATIFVGLSRGVRVPWLRLLLLVLLLHMALQHARHQFVLVMVAPMILAPAFAVALDNRPGSEPGRRLLTGWLALAFGAFLGLTVMRFAFPPPEGGDRANPSAALAHVPPTLAARPVFNEYSFGGYLVYAGLKPYIDGRADMYGDAFMHRYARLAAGDPKAVEADFARYGVAWTLLPPDHPVNALLAKRPDWVRIYDDGIAVVYAREDAVR